MKFTIVTPSYQQGCYLECTIESVLKQCCETVDLEYFILDNCSTDETVNILKNMKITSKLKLFDRLIWVKRMQLIEVGHWGTGDIFAWLNADDIYLD